MDAKVFFSTFVLIFLAELGDKTQLTALAAASGNKSTWTVFWAASAALVLSTLLAVITGVLLKNQSLIPMSAIKIIAGLLFLFFGFMTIREGLTEEKQTKTSESTSTSGFFFKMALNAAVKLEKAQANFYELTAQQVECSELKKLLLEIARQEREHSNVLAEKFTKIDESQFNETKIPIPESPSTPLDQNEVHILEKLINSELNMAKFYSKLANLCKLDSIRTIFLKLEQEELEHVSILKSYQSGIR